MIIIWKKKLSKKGNLKELRRIYKLMKINENNFITLKMIWNMKNVT